MHFTFSESKMGVRVFYYIKEHNPILDSSNMSMKHWTLIARDIKENYPYFDSFVVLHGTDTMSYTASALSYMFENLDKTVIITGSQVCVIYFHVFCVSQGVYWILIKTSKLD